jgi:hypothetical protein
MTATFCYDMMGHAWGTSPVKYSVISGAFLGIDNPPDYVTIVGGAYARIHSGYYLMFLDAPGDFEIRAEPRLKINGTSGAWSAYDGGSTAVTNYGSLVPELGPVFVSAVLQ